MPGEKGKQRPSSEGLSLAGRSAYCLPGVTPQVLSIHVVNHELRFAHVLPGKSRVKPYSSNNAIHRPHRYWRDHYRILPQKFMSFIFPSRGIARHGAHHHEKAVRAGDSDCHSHSQRTRYDDVVSWCDQFAN